MASFVWKIYYWCICDENVDNCINNTLHKNCNKYNYKSVCIIWSSYPFFFWKFRQQSWHLSILVVKTSIKELVIAEDYIENNLIENNLIIRVFWI